MAEDSTGVAAGDAPTARLSLWQVPVFLAGVMALAGVWYGRPYWRGTERKHLERELADVRHLLAQSPPDLDRALEIGDQILAPCEAYPDLAGQAHFLVGSAYLRSADSPAGPAAADKQRQAREHLEHADRLGVPDADKARLSYRLAKTWFTLGADARQVIDRLAPTLESGADDPFEGYGILAQSYLRLPKPDLAAALEASKKQLAAPTRSEDLLAPARLFQGELLLKLNDPAAARQILSRVGPRASPRTLARVRQLKAQCGQTLKLWSEAAELWEAVLTDAFLPPSNPNRVRFLLGECYQELGRRPDAKRVWEAAVAHGGEEGQAAALALAQFHLRANDSAAAFAAFDTALRGVTKPTDYHNSLVERAEARRLIERGWEHLHAKADFLRADRLAELYERLALPGVAVRLRGLTQEAWGNESAKAKKTKEAHEHYRLAATAFAAVAAAASDAPTKAQWLRRSADRSADAADFPVAAATLTKYLEVEPAPNRSAEGWYLLAKTYEQRRDEPAALAAYRKCIEFPGPFAFRARYRLAELDLVQGKTQSAVDTLMQNLQLMRLANDDTVHALTLFLLADLFYQEGNYHMALAHYKEALDRYPAHANAFKARLRLADCYHRLATKEYEQYSRYRHVPPVVLKNYSEQYYLNLDKAIANFQKLFDDLRAKSGADRLTADEEQIRSRVEFALPECLFERGRYEEALTIYQMLAARHEGRVEQLLALQQMCRCSSAMQQHQFARQTVRRAEAAFQALDAAGAFRAPAGGTAGGKDEPWRTREYWVEWLQSAKRLY